MSTNEDRLSEFFLELNIKRLSEDFVVDKSGVKMVEILCPVMKLDPRQKTLDFGARKTPEEYVKTEIELYDSQSLSVEKIGKKSKIWQNVADKNGFINSNYGWCIYSKDNGEQYKSCLEELKQNKLSRRAVMIYQRPSMWEDYKRDCMSDFICTDGVQIFIRKDTLIYVAKQRSCDAIYGFFNDFYWHCVVYERLFEDLKKIYPKLKDGSIYYHPFSFHVYEKHFDMLRKMIEFYNGGIWENLEDE